MELHVATLSFSWMFGKTCSFHIVRLNYKKQIRVTKIRHNFPLCEVLIKNPAFPVGSAGNQLTVCGNFYSIIFLMPSRSNPSVKRNV
jgi:hypothetical protein